MRFCLFFIVGFLLLALQTTFLQTLPEWVGVPDLLFLLILFLALFYKPWPGAVLAVVFGIGIEVCSGYFLGLYSLAYLGLFFIIRGLAANFVLDAVNHQPPLVALSYLAVNAFVYFSSAMLSDVPLYPWGWGVMLQRTLIVTILVIPANRVFATLSNWCEKRVKRRSFFARKKGNYYNRASR